MSGGDREEASQNAFEKPSKKVFEKASPKAPEKAPWKLRLYQKLLREGVEPWLISRVFSESRRRSSWDPRRLLPEKTPGVRRYWFHAASVGELEALWPVLKEMGREASGPAAEPVLTIFSESAQKPLIRLVPEMEAAPGWRLLFAGYSPWEGRWEEAIRQVGPNVFVTTRYEAWPELWSVLGTAGIPLVIVAASPRRSLSVASRMCRLLGSPLPKMMFFSATPDDARTLKRLFPHSRVETSGDPRWDRVYERSRQGNARASALVSKLASLPRPWGVLGSAWEKDLEYGLADRALIRGTLWVVPHSVDEESIQRFEKRLTSEGWTVQRTSRLEAQVLEGAAAASELGKRHAVLVDEMGFLAELYSSADWAYVGGGFGAGVHSTIEPAIHGLPIACGPARADRFPEIAELAKFGQLTVVRDSASVREFVKRAQDEPATHREIRRDAVRDQLGAAGRIARSLRL